MMTIDIETISGVPLTGLLNDHASDDVGDDQEAQAEREQRRHREQHVHEARIDAVEHRCSRSLLPRSAAEWICEGPRLLRGDVRAAGMRAVTAVTSGHDALTCTL